MKHEGYQRKLLYMICAAVLFMFCGCICFGTSVMAAAPANPVMNDYCIQPPFISQNVPPLVMLIMSKDEKLFYRGYNDLVDLDGDGTIDTNYKDTINYYGYFNPNTCYDYSTDHFVPASAASGTNNHYCTGRWSGNFLNWAAMSRIDIIRKVLYGGKRSVDTTSSTVLSRTVLPQDAHSWAKPYKGSDLNQLTPVSWSEGITLCNTNTSASETSGLIYAIRGYFPYAASTEGKECTKTATSGGGVPLTVAASLGAVASPNPGGIVSWTRTTNTSECARLQGSNRKCYYHTCSDDYYGTVTCTDGTNHNCPSSSHPVVGACDTATTSTSSQTIDLGSGSAYYASFTANVEVCNSSFPESNCEKFGSNYKPRGLLQRYGLGRQGSANEPLMYFGLMSGSYNKNASGGVLRSNLADIGTQEISQTTGQVLSSSKIIKNLDRLQIVGYDFGTSWYSTCTPGEPYVLLNADAAVTANQCHSWGNPVGEMFYETMRYFAGKSGPRSEYYNSTSPDDGLLGLTTESSWCDPYTGGGSCQTFPYCSKPFSLIVSDVFPNFDSDQLPGVYSGFGSMTDDITGTLSVQTMLTNSGINNLEPSASSNLASGQNIFIGQSLSTSDKQCTLKSASDFGAIRGLCIEEPSKRGSFYIAGLANYARTNRLHPNVSGKETSSKLTTFTVATESIVPIEITSGASKVTIIPTFNDGCPNDTISGCSSAGAGGDGSKGSMVYMKVCPDTSIDLDWAYENATNHYQYCYDIMWDDAEYGWDYDLDIAARHYIKVSGGNVTVKTKALYAAAGHVDYAGYFINGVSGSGVQYDIKCGGSVGFNSCQKIGDATTSINADPRNTTAYVERTFAITGGGGGFLHDPLWYAAKYGGFDDIDGDSKPNLAGEWNQKGRTMPNGDPMPDTYFYAANPLQLESRLGEAMQEILGRVASGTAASVLASSEGSGANMLQAVFYPKRLFESSETTWTGELMNLWYYIDPQLTSSTIREDTVQGSTPTTERTLNLADDYVIEYDFDTVTNTTRIIRKDDTGGGTYTTVDSIPLEEVKYIWSAGKSLFDRSASSRNIKYGRKNASIWTMEDFVISNFISPDDAVLNIIPYNAVSYPYTDPTATQIVDYVRGTDNPAFRNRTVTINSTSGVWKLGDIVSSTPRIQSTFPLNGYHNSPPDGYNDKTYLSFISKYANPEDYKNRGMVYTGANDGMLHAFYLGKLEYLNTGTNVAKLTATTGNGFGEEKWAYIPNNALPYLKYLLSKDYCHLFYVDTPVSIADASVIGVSSDPSVDPKTTASWRTILIGGMGMGGACRDRTVTCSGLNCVNVPKTDIGYSSYFALDVTDQYNPVLLWEFTDPGLGFSTSGPAIVRIGDKDKNGKWMAVFASGPTGPIDTSSFHQFMGKSDQNLKLFVRDLYTGADMGSIDTGIVNGFGGSLSSATLDLERGKPSHTSNYQDDVLYLGYTTNTEGGVSDTTWSKGGVLRVVTNNSTTVSNWSASKFIKGIGPVTSAVAKLHDTNNYNLWTYFGTGRFYYRRGSDIDNKTPTPGLKLYGVKDPCYGHLTSHTACTESTYSDIVPDTGSLGNFVDQTITVSTIPAGKQGWSIDLEPTTASTGEYGAERVITDPLAVFSGAVFFTTFTPAADVCSLGGNSRLWAVKYNSGGDVALEGKALMQISTGEVKQIDLSTITNRHTAYFKGMPPRGQGLSVLLKPKPLRKILQMKEK